MPSEHYMVEAKLILGTAPEDVPRFEEIRTAIKDIWDIRAAKLRTSMDDFIKGEGTYAKLDYLTTMEIHSVRPLLPHSLDMIARLERVGDTEQTFMLCTQLIMDILCCILGLLLICWRQLNAWIAFTHFRLS